MRTALMVWLLLTVPSGIGVFCAAWRILQLHGRFPKHLFRLLVAVSVKDFLLTLAFLTPRNSIEQIVALFAAQTIWGLGAWWFALFMMGRVDRNDRPPEHSLPPDDKL